jgi:hypothetical protein
MNKYGYLRYMDIPIGAEDVASYTTDISLQENSSPAQLGVGVEPYNYASFEKGAYITSRPNKIYKSGNLGLLSTEVSDENGFFATPIKITIELEQVFSISGLTISSKEIIKNGEIIVYNILGIEAHRLTISATKKTEFYKIGYDTSKIEIIVNQIDKPYRFFGLYDIAFGRVINIDESICTNVEISRYFSVMGDTLEYDTLDLNVLDTDNEFMFLPRQRIDYVKDKKVEAVFYINNAEEQGVNVSISCYDYIANLDDEFLGGIYNNYSFKSLVFDILNGKNVPYNVDTALNEVFVTGYIPITTRRKALQMLLFGTNTRCYKKEKLYFKPFNYEVENTVLDESNILQKPKKTKAQDFKAIMLKHQTFAKTKEEIELYHWYISTTRQVMIKFDGRTPMYSLKAYEVTGVDEYGADIVDTKPSENVTFIETNANYCIVENKSSNKIVIKGKKYKNNVETVTYEEMGIPANVDYPTLVFDVSVTDDINRLLFNVYALYNKTFSYNLITTENVKIGENRSVLGENLTIKKVTTNLSGLYEVEAV